MPVDAGSTHYKKIMGQPHKRGLNIAAVKMRKNFLTRYVAAAVVLAAAFPFSNTAQALNIGEVVSQSRIGEPLRTQIELTGSGNETVDETCLSLIAPDQGEEGASEFVTVAKLAVKTEGKRQFVVISSHRPYNDPFLRIKLQVRCVGTGHIVKSFTILPDFVDVLPVTAPVTAPVAAAATSSVVAAGSSAAGRNDKAPGDDRDILAEYAKKHPRRSKHRATAAIRDDSGASGQLASVRGESSAQTVRSNRGKSESFRLRLSGEPLDESRIGKISQEERSLLRARQKLLDADDQMASFLALQDQVKQLQAELSVVKLQLGQLGVSSPAGASSDASAQLAPSQENDPLLAQQTAAATVQPAEATADDVQTQQDQNVRPAKQRKPKMQRGPIIMGLLALLGLLLGLRYYLRIRTQSAAAKPVLKRSAVAPVAVPEPAGAPAPAPASQPSMQTKIAQPGAKPAAKPAAKPSAVRPPASMAGSAAPPKSTIAPPAAKKMAAPSPMAASPAHEKTQEELAEADSIIEEAELYAIHGHPDRAVLILKELIQQHATKTEAWMLLFSIYSSLKKAPEFEKAARDFIKANKDSALWLEIQALGRSVDSGNVLYADSGMTGAAASALQPVLGKRPLLGDILLAMGALSIKDMEKCLGEFDPKVDGRFGGFLIKRNMITEAQLEAALQQQQRNNEANTHQAQDASKAEDAPNAEDVSEPKKQALPALEFEPPAMDLPKMTKSLESNQTPTGDQTPDK